MNCPIKKLLLITTITTTYSSGFLDISKMGFEQYQDIVINGKVVQPATGSHRDCSTRYEIIKKALEKYNRPFTMLDIGASQGYYSFRTAYEYPESVCVMLEGNNSAYPHTGSQLFDLCTLNTELNNIVLLQKKVIPKDIKRLSECEHFDVILAMNILHWLGNEWRLAAKAIVDMGATVIVETPPQESIISYELNKQRKEIEDFLIDNGATVLGQVKRHTSNTMSTIYIIEKNIGALERRTWMRDKEDPKNHLIYSNYKKKELTKKVDYPANTYLTSEWLPGINLITFKMYNGTYPLNQQIKKNIEKLKNIPSNDWMPNNMIIQGNNIVMIDIDDPNHNSGGHGGGRHFSAQLLKNIFDFVDEKNPSLAEKIFWEKVVKSK